MRSMIKFGLGIVVGWLIRDWWQSTQDNSPYED